MENNQNIKMGDFISELRKSNHLTQKDLAEHLGVTDKAVSKWERGLSCPDISLLIPLAKLLGVTTGELLNCQLKSEPVNTETENMVDEVLVYSNIHAKKKLDVIRKNFYFILSGCFIIALGVCLICDFCTSGSLSWSLIVAASLLAAWLLLLPVYMAEHHIIRTSLILLSLIVIPYLLVLSLLLAVPMLFTMGTVISVISLVTLWCVYAVFTRLSNKIFCALGLFFLLAIPCSIGINLIVALFTKAPLGNAFGTNSFTYSLLLLIALLCFGINFLAGHLGGEKDVRHQP